MPAHAGKQGEGAAPQVIDALRARTPARLVVGRAGTSYRTATQLELREDHAAAVDAVQAEMDLARDFGAELLNRYGLFEVATLAADKSQYLQRPELGRALSEASKALIRERCPRGVDLQVAIGDGLSAAAVAAQRPPCCRYWQRAQQRAAGRSAGRSPCAIAAWACSMNSARWSKRESWCC